MPTYDDDALLFLGYAEQKGVGFKTLREIGGVEAVAQRLRDGSLPLEPSADDPLAPSPLERIESAGAKIVDQLRRSGVDLLRRGDPAYPKALLDLTPETQPLWLFVRGNLALLNSSCVAVVGTRAPSEVGRFLARYAVSTCAEMGMPVLSGLAKGVDGIAHEWCLKAHHPTVSVLGTGILHPYPASHLDLAENIVEQGGLLISEYMPFSEPAGEHFVWRNRLQAALSRCVIAPEWKAKSGTAHTIRFAKELLRPTVNLRVYGVVEGHERGPSQFSVLVPSEHSMLEKILIESTSTHAADAEGLPDNAEATRDEVAQGTLWR